jgi:hypothetical protein
MGKFVLQYILNFSPIQYQSYPNALNATTYQVPITIGLNGYGLLNHGTDYRSTSLAISRKPNDFVVSAPILSFLNGPDTSSLL